MKIVDTTPIETRDYYENALFSCVEGWNKFFEESGPNKRPPYLTLFSLMLVHMAAGPEPCYLDTLVFEAREMLKEDLEFRRKNISAVGSI